MSGPGHTKEHDYEPREGGDEAQAPSEGGDRWTAAETEGALRYTAVQFVIPARYLP